MCFLNHGCTVQVLHTLYSCSCTEIIVLMCRSLMSLACARQNPLPSPWFAGYLQFRSWKSVIGAAQIDTKITKINGWKIGLVSKITDMAHVWAPIGTPSFQWFRCTTGLRPGWLRSSQCHVEIRVVQWFKCCPLMETSFGIWGFA